ncbi:hypothetical protein SV7mr_36070 [Stieleria bergensis]|uniref:Uncharacterized protein n=1 Tax=Stieleria bergensis TaxID=2528025 RepID=A0A517SY51_9BACT|nr:hypothetical protein SV7mr_36070 [Planctomycetes bacterium SV_7m_r]
MIGCSIAAAGREQADMARSTLFALAAGFQLAAVAALPIPLGDSSWRFLLAMPLGDAIAGSHQRSMRRVPVCRGIFR